MRMLMRFAFLSALATAANGQNYRPQTTIPVPVIAAPTIPASRFDGPIAAAPAVADGRADGLNIGVYDVLRAIIRRNPGSWTLANAVDLRTAVQQDGKIDAAEADLLFEMTQSVFRPVQVRPIGTPADAPAVQVRTVVGNAKTVLQETYNPQLDLPRAWQGGAPGWQAILRESDRNPVQTRRVAEFVRVQVADAWEASSIGNGYKPLRELIARVYGYGNAPGTTAAQRDQGRKLLYDAVEQTDRAATGQVPDFLYTWLLAPNPGN